jgi:hypothetical protein
MANAPAPGLIELRLNTLEQLFDPFDPFPIPTRDLARSAEEFVVGWAREHASDARLAIRIYLPAEAVSKSDIDSLRSAFAAHFQYRARRTGSDMRDLLGIAQVTLLIGLCVLGACIGVRQVLREAAASNAAAGFFSEGLAIVGWVANWRPIEILLFEWWPLARRRKLFERLAAAPVEVIASAPDSAMPS